MLARHPRLFWILVVALAALFARPAAAADRSPADLSGCTAASCVNSYWGEGQIAAGFGVDAFRPGQTFTPRFSGVLNTVRLGLDTDTGSPANAVAEIRPTVNGVPTNVILAEAPVPGAPYAPGVLHDADFTPQHVVLVAGTRYAVTLRSAGHQYILAAFPPCSAALTGTNDYVSSDDGGQTWSIYFVRDRSIIYEVCMDAATAARTSTWGRVKAIYR